MAKQRTVYAREAVIAVLREIAKPHAQPIVRFSKAEFIRTYWRLRRQGRIYFVKLETLLRYLRKLAEESRIVKYADRRKGTYILDQGELP